MIARFTNQGNNNVKVDWFTQETNKEGHFALEYTTLEKNVPGRKLHNSTFMVRNGKTKIIPVYCIIPEQIKSVCYASIEISGD